MKKKIADLQERVATVIVERVLCVQRAWAHWMGKRTAGWTVRQLKAALFCLVGLFASGSVWIMVDGFTKPHAQVTRVDSIPLPVLPTATLPKAASLPASVQHAIRWVDSLQLTQDNVLLDSLQRVRPGLLDSVAYLRKLYSSYSSTIPYDTSR